MSDRLKRFREQRGALVTEMRTLVDTAENEKRELTGDELAKHSTLFDKADNLRKQIEAEQRTVESERAAADAAAEAEERAAKNPEAAAKEDRAMKAFRSLLRGATPGGDVAAEMRALQAGSDTEGGYISAPGQFVAQLLKNVDNAVFVRNRATKFQVPKAESLGVPTLDTDLADADWTTELQTGSEDTSMRFGKRELRPHPVAKLLKVSKKLVRTSALPIETIINDRMAYKFGVTCEKAYMTGDGAQKPLGMFTASADGIPTSRDVSTGNTTTSVTWDGLINAKYSVKAQYWPNSAWVFHRDALKQISKLKDGDGQYLWRPSQREADPDMILGRPMEVSEYAPNTFTTGLYVGLFGDLSYYWIADALDMTVQVLRELYAATNQDGFIARQETDGMPVLSEAFARVALA